MNMIVAVDRNWAIGYKNKLLISIPADHKNFRQETTGKVVVLGRKTMDTFPGRKPLPNRTNIIITRNPEYIMKDAIILHSLEELKRELEKYNSEDIYIIGGDSIYRQMLDECDVAYVTKVEWKYEADTYFPNLDERDDWELTGVSDEQIYYDITYKFLRYERVKNK